MARFRRQGCRARPHRGKDVLDREDVLVVHEAQQLDLPE